MNYPFNLLKQVPVLSVACILPRMLYSLENVCRPPVIVISRCQLEKSTEMKVWNEKALQTSPSLSLVLGFIFVLKESFFAILVLYQEGCGVMRYFGVERRETMTKKEKNPSSVNVAVSLTVMGISDLPHKHRLALFELYMMSPPRPVSGHWTARTLMEGPKWDRCHLKWSLNKTWTESEKHDSFANEKDLKMNSQQLRCFSPWNTYITPLNTAF